MSLTAHWAHRTAPQPTADRPVLWGGSGAGASPACRGSSLRGSRRGLAGTDWSAHGEETLSVGPTEGLVSPVRLGALVCDWLWGRSHALALSVA